MVLPRRWYCHGDGTATEMVLPRRWYCHGDGTATEEKKMKTKAEMDGLSNEIYQDNKKMKSVTEMTGGEICLPQV